MSCSIEVVEYIVWSLKWVFDSKYKGIMKRLNIEPFVQKYKAYSLSESAEIKFLAMAECI